MLQERTLFTLRHISGHDKIFVRNPDGGKRRTATIKGHWMSGLGQSGFRPWHSHPGHLKFSSMFQSCAGAGPLWRSHRSLDENMTVF